jgi:hypothetical protein
VALPATAAEAKFAARPERRPRGRQAVGEHPRLIEVMSARPSPRRFFSVVTLP